MPMIDNFDMPITSEHHTKYYCHTIDFFRRLYSSLLNNNSNIHKAFVVGVLPIEMHMLLPGVDLLSYDRYVDQFRFTEPEVIQLHCKHINEDMPSIDNLRDLYGGYWVRKCELYNPRLIIKYITNN
ncbi:hypothetical protein BC938DRAFT_477147 [Jimgerdemannia flammicorona]|uniref:Uncharacterized protein n=1 Tax=Jimgerdemannia flammicorona TaxID=994334 RepID=A0A433PBP7_9FUNG|nr:hypothetical protein BC938DRAFT_477147 [Jimgerdemannia flammicorona]